MFQKESINLWIQILWKVLPYPSKASKRNSDIRGQNFLFGVQISHQEAPNPNSNETGSRKRWDSFVLKTTKTPGWIISKLLHLPAEAFVKTLLD